MPASTSKTRAAKNGSATSASPADVLNAYLEKSVVVQAVIRDLVNIVKNGQLPGQERGWAAKSLDDALFRYQGPARANLKSRASVEQTRQLSGLREAHQRMEEEERLFAGKLERLLQEKNMSQAELARRVGVQPSAISMMLTRHCRPQSRTIDKLAKALGVKRQELWPRMTGASGT